LLVALVALRLERNEKSSAEKNQMVPV
jgi:hypothetical protein